MLIGVHAMAMRQEIRRIHYFAYMKRRLAGRDA